MKCYSCGTDKDLTKEEVYPYQEDYLTIDPISPLMVIECQVKKVYRAVVVCHECFHKLSPDMWISEKCWNSLNPSVTIDELPAMEGNKWDPSSYPNL